MAQTRTKKPKWDWTFDLKEWPQGSFLGRRWLEWHRGNVVKPQNGCIYFWTCVVATMMWVVVTVITPPILLLTPSKVKVRNAEQIRSKLRRQGSLILRPIGKYALHPIFLGRYSPLRLIGRGMLIILVPVNRFMVRFVDDFIKVAVVVGVISVLAVAFYEIPIVAAIVLVLIITIVVPLVLLKMFHSSEIGKVIIGMAEATKNRWCPSINLVDSRSGSTISVE